MTPVDVRSQLVDARRLDLVGPGEACGADGAGLGDAAEILPQRPSAWYLTGFLMYLDASRATQRRTTAGGAAEMRFSCDGAAAGSKKPR